MVQPPSQEEVHDEDYFIRKMRERVTAYHERMSSAEVADRNQIYRPETQADRIRARKHRRTGSGRQ